MLLPQIIPVPSLMLTVAICSTGDLIHNVADLLDQLLDLDDGLLQVWSGPVLIQAITEALNQISSDRVNTLSLLHHSLQVISTTDSGIDGLVELSEKVHPLVSSFISDVFEDGVLSMRGRENTLASVISVLSVMVLRSRDVSKHLAQKESRTIKQLTEMLYIIHRKEASSLSQKLPTNEDTPPPAPAHPNNIHQENASSDKQEKRDGGRGDGVLGGGGDGRQGDGHHGDMRKEEEEDQEKVWLTELLKDQLIDFFCCILEVAKKDKALQQRLHACGPKRLQAIADCLPEDRNDLSDLMGNIQGKS
eukprot:XP_003729042.1 PREDICTED: uncharacterized protein LOC100891705 [Strongylocentrotus purpuratus]